MHTLLLTIALAAAPPQFEVRTLDGPNSAERTLTGEIVSIETGRITVQTPDGPVSLATRTLMNVVRSDEARVTADEGPARVWIDLVDGSVLHGREYSVHDGRAKIVLADGHAIDLPAAGIAAVRLRNQGDRLAGDWQRILGMEVETDLLVVRKGSKADDEAIDYHRGVLRDVTDEIVHFELDGDVLPVKRTKVHGLVYYRPSARAPPKSVCRLTDTSGSRWSVAELSMAEGLQWTTCGGLTIARGPDAVTQIDFSGGKVVFLSDLKPESVAFTPYFGTAENVPVLAGFRAPRRDKNLQHGPLQLDKKKYNKGLALHSRTEVVYRLPDRFRRFKALAGIDDAVRPQGNVRLVISGDDRVLLETSVVGTDPAKPIDLDLSGVRRLRILVDFGENLDVADHLDLCEARVSK